MYLNTVINILSFFVNAHLFMFIISFLIQYSKNVTFKLLKHKLIY